MSEERKRYCFVLDRASIVAKSTMEFCEHVGILYLVVNRSELMLTV